MHRLGFFRSGPLPERAKSTTEADEMGLTVDEQHDAPQDRLGIERILGDTVSQRVPVADHAVGGKLYLGS